jgi:hypothetical protein
MDGIMPFAYDYFFLKNPYNDFSDPAKAHRSNVMIYPSEEGPVPTIEWQSMSEGINDGRYLATWQWYHDLVISKDVEVAQNSKDVIDSILEK